MNPFVSLFVVVILRELLHLFFTCFGPVLLLKNVHFFVPTNARLNPIISCSNSANLSTIFKDYGSLAQAEATKRESSAASAASAMRHINLSGASGGDPMDTTEGNVNRK